MKYLLLFLVLLAGSAGAEENDSDLVHGLAHGGAGAMVAMATDTVPVNIARYDLRLRNQKMPWYMPILIDSGMAFLADEAYELATEKTPTVLAQHNLDATLGGLLYSVHLEVEF
ncbi:MAG TPA: hypothetical protein VK914_05015 [bacterium]|jgi:hypothetical protein|nr:hypothetical protein [bacterium]